MVDTGGVRLWQVVREGMWTHAHLQSNGSAKGPGIAQTLPETDSGLQELLRAARGCRSYCGFTDAWNSASTRSSAAARSASSA